MPKWIYPPNPELALSCATLTITVVHVYFFESQCRPIVGYTPLPLASGLYNTMHCVFQLVLQFSDDFVFPYTRKLIGRIIATLHKLYLFFLYSVG